MATEMLDELSRFHRYLSERLHRGAADLTPEDCLREWRAEQAERAATIAAVREGLDDIQDGRVKTLEEFDRDFRQRHNLPQAQ